MDDKDFDKQVDLDPSEYSYKGKHEPAFGRGALPFVVMLILSFLLAPIISYLVTGHLPYWVRPLLG